MQPGRSAVPPFSQAQQHLFLARQRSAVHLRQSSESAAFLSLASGNSPVLKKTHAAQGLLRNAAAAGGSATAAAAASELLDVVAFKKNKRMLAEAGVMQPDAAAALEDDDSAAMRTLLADDWPKVAFSEINTVNGDTTSDLFGRRITISGDGSVMAVGAPGGKYVKLFSYNGSDYSQEITTLSGSDKFGSRVSLSHDGSILAVGAYGHNGNNGQVTLYKRDVNTYELSQTLSGAADSNLGMALELSDDGSVLALGLPYRQDLGSARNFGEMQVWAYDDATKLYVKRYTSDVQLRGFGVSLAMSGDGSTVVVGHQDYLYQSVDDSARVHVFKFTPGDYSNISPYIIVEPVEKAYGGDMDVSADGSFIAVGSRIAKRIHTYQLNGSTYDKLPVIEGTGTYFGNGVALSGDGLTLAASSISGYVNIFKFDGAIYDKRSDDVTISDTRVGWAYSIDLSSDGSTLVVGASSYTFGTAEAWNINGEEAPWSVTFKDMAANFTEAYAGSQITLKYDIGRVDLSDKRDFKTELYSNTDGLCNTAPSNDVFTSALEINSENGGSYKKSKSILYEELVLGYVIDTSKIANSNIWNSATGEIELCQKVMLTTPGPDVSQMTVVEDIRNVTVLFDLNAGFEVNDIDLDAATISANNQNTTLSDYLSSYKCDAQGTAATGTNHAPNDQLFICLESSSPDVLIDEVNEMKITGLKPDGTDSTLPVIGSDSIPTFRAITSITGVDTTKVQVSTFVATNMFNFETEGAQIDVSGSVMMKFKDGRKLAVDLPDRMLQAANEDEAAEFDVVINIQSENEDLGLEGGDAMMSSAMAASGGKVVAILGMVIVSAFALW